MLNTLDCMHRSLRFAANLRLNEFDNQLNYHDFNVHHLRILDVANEKERQRAIQKAEKEPAHLLYNHLVLLLYYDIYILPD